ncbi:MAG: hypothetical protein NTX64_09405 [Elusimicrobia bacterium]|nr:hypothetical protein [Elusimicrobiota bacterium]
MLGGPLILLTVGLLVPYGQASTDPEAARENEITVKPPNSMKRMPLSLEALQAVAEAPLPASGATDPATVEFLATVARLRALAKALMEPLQTGGPSSTAPTAWRATSACSTRSRRLA